MAGKKRLLVLYEIVPGETPKQAAKRFFALFQKQLKREQQRDKLQSK